MERTLAKPEEASQVQPSSELSDVLTLAEAAAYLRVSDEALLRTVGVGGVPGRLIGGEWRFLKAALQDWLRTSPKPSSREALLSVAGAWKDDPYLDEMLKEIYRQRGRPMTEDGERSSSTRTF